METVAENERLYTKKQVSAAGRARDFIAAMGFQSTKNVIEIVRSGRVEGIDFEVEDVTRCIEIYGPALEALRGKSAWVKRSHAGQKAAGKVVDADVTMHVDVAFFWGIGFLVSYVTPLALLLAEWIMSRSVSDVKAAIDRQRAS